MYTKEEEKIIKSLNTPDKIQNFLNKLNPNLIKSGKEYRDSCYSPRLVLKYKRAHCVEGAIFAAAVLRYHGYKPLIVDMEATTKDYDHVIAVFKRFNRWGAISKTNHVVLRYREPVYRDVKELIMSYFHEYTDPKGKKTLRSFSNPINLRKFDKFNWEASDSDIWYIPEYLCRVKHHKILNRKQISCLRKADEIEIKLSNMKEYRR